MDFFEFYVPDWRWTTASEFRHRAVLSLGETMTAALTGGRAQA